MVREKKKLPPVYYCAGAAIVSYSLFYFLRDADFAVQSTAMLSAAVLFFPLSFCAACFFFPDSTQRKSSFFFAAMLICGGLQTGCISYAVVLDGQKPITTLADRQRVMSIQGVLLSDPQPAGTGKQRFLFLANTCEYADGSVFSVHGRIIVRTDESEITRNMPGGIQGNGLLPYSAGLSVSLAGKLGSYRAGSGDIFFSDGIKKETIPLLSNPVSRTRAFLRSSLVRILYDWKESGGLLLALISGNRDYLTPALSESFRSAGLSHILALSGMHLTLIGMLAFWAAFRLFGKNAATRTVLASAALFVFFAGFSPSLNRALIMLFILHAGKKSGIQIGLLPVLSVTLFLQMILFPEDISSIACILSYGALAGIAVFVPSVSSMCDRYLPPSLNQSFSASVGAQIFTLPVTAAAFGACATAGVIASIVVCPLADFFFFSGIFCIAISCVFPPLEPLCRFAIDFLYRLIDGSVTFFSHMPVIAVRDLSGIVAVCILSVMAGMLVLYFSAYLRKQRLPDAGFARL